MRVQTLFLAALVFFWAALPSLAMADSEEAYRLLPGDTVLVSVWGEDSMKMEVHVLPDGSITYPLAGRVEVTGLSTPEVEKRIAEKLKDFFPEPQVTVVVANIDGNRAYILGKVLKPGPFPIIGPMTVLQALSMAGGLDKFADLGAIKVLRATDAGQEVIPVHYDKLLRGEDMNTNILLQSGDTILVP